MTSRGGFDLGTECSIAAGDLFLVLSAQWDLFLVLSAQLIVDELIHDYHLPTLCQELIHHLILPNEIGATDSAFQDLPH